MTAQRSAVKFQRAFEAKIGETPTLSEIRGWANKLWKQAHELNIYEMAYFLFEFDPRSTGKQVAKGDWDWKNSPVTL